MQKPQDSDQELVFYFIDMALRHLEGGRENPKFKPMVLWALQNIPALRRIIGPLDHSPNFFHFLSEKAKKAIEGVATEEERKKILEKILIEDIRVTSTLIREWMKENKIPLRDFESTKARLNREKVDMPEEIAGDIGMTFFHIQTNGKSIEPTKAKFWTVHPEDFEKMLDDTPSIPEEPDGRTI
ncbi:MAG: hypothetical protein ACR2NF_00290 [Pirellulales bacterium]